MNYSDAFEWVWMRRPKRDGGDSKANAYKAWCARLKAGFTEREMAEGLNRYGKWLEARGQIGTRYVMQTATFFGPGEHFTELWEVRQQVIKTKDRSVSQGLTDRSWASNDYRAVLEDTSWATDPNFNPLEFKQALIVKIN